MADHGNVATSVSEPEEHPGPSPLSILDVLKAPKRTELIYPQRKIAHRRKGNDALGERDLAIMHYHSIPCTTTCYHAVLLATVQYH